MWFYLLHCLKSEDSFNKPTYNNVDFFLQSQGSPLLEFLLISTLSVVFLVTYVTHMYVVEVYLARADTHFHFMALKYCFGCLHLVLLPLAIIALKPDIRDQSFWREIQLFMAD